MLPDRIGQASGADFECGATREAQRKSGGSNSWGTRRAREGDAIGVGAAGDCDDSKSSGRWHSVHSVGTSREFRKEQLQAAQTGATAIGTANGGCIRKSRSKK